jgi:hypothetical protein
MAQEGFRDLFDGESLDGWSNPYEWGQAQVVEGEIHLTADRKFFLVTDETFSDFVFEGEVHLPEGQANSGFMFRCHKEPNRVFGYQAEVDGSERRWSGGLYDEGRRAWLWPRRPTDKDDEETKALVERSQAHFATEEVKNAFKRDDWNQYRITCVGDQIKIEVNGVVTTEYTDDVDASGYLAIQHHGEKGQTYRFRNLRVKPLTE